LAVIAILGFLSVTVLFTWLEGPLHATPHAVAGGGADRALMLHALERYAVLAANMTHRIRVAEEALLRLQKVSVAAPRGTGRASDASISVPGEGAGFASAESSVSSASSDESSEDNDAEETDEQAEKRRNLEIVEQNQLIGFDPVTKMFKTRFRPDFKCGDRAPPLPDNEIVECDPIGEAPCCSNLGWCGKSAVHCVCDGCEDYQDKVTLEILGVEAVANERECKDIAYSFGEVESPAVCAGMAMKQADCGRMLMFSHEYKEWGCRCCAASTGQGDEKKPEWTLYKINVKATPKEDESATNVASQ